MRHKLLLASVISAAALFGCQTSKNDRPRSGGGGGEGDEEEEITYEGWVKGFMETNCASCHGADAGEDGGPDYSTFAKVKAAQKKIVTRIESSDAKKKMPPKKTLKDTQIEKFKAWVDQGMKQGKKSGKPATAKVTYDGWIKNYEEKSCGSGSAGCHSAATKTGVDLSDFENSAKNADASLASLKAKRMPKGTSEVDDAAVIKYTAWIKDGKLENDSGSGTATDTGSSTDTNTDTGGSEEAKAKGFTLLKSAKGCGGDRCHDAGVIPPALDTDQALEAAKDSVLRTAKNGSMPKNNPYTDAEKQIVQDWYDSL